MRILLNLIGYLSSISWFWILLGILSTLAFISNALLRFDECLYRNRIQDKLTFDSVIIGRSIHDNEIIIGIKVNNAATFHIEFDVQDIKTRLGTTVPSKSHQSKKFTVPPNGYGWYYDNAIQLLPPPQTSLEGFIDFTLKYGKPGALKYNLIGKKQIIAVFNEGLLVNASWNDAIRDV